MAGFDLTETLFSVYNTGKSTAPHQVFNIKYYYYYYVKYNIIIIVKQTNILKTE
jgi:hypothetical protein